MEKNDLLLLFIISATEFEEDILEMLAHHKARSVLSFRARSSAGDLFTLLDEKRIVCTSVVTRENKDKIFKILNKRFEFFKRNTGIAFALNFDNNLFFEQIQKLEDKNGK